jgi:hypothetical protein
MPNRSEPELTDIFDRTSSQRQLFQTLSITVGLASAGLFLLLFWQALAIRESGTQEVVRIVSVARLELIRLSKEPLEGGYHLTFQMLPGLAWYYAGWILAGLASLLGRRLVGRK